MTSYSSKTEKAVTNSAKNAKAAETDYSAYLNKDKAEE